MEARTQDPVLWQIRTVPSILNASLAPPEFRVVNRKEILRVLERAAHDPGFIGEIADRGSAALGSYHLTLPEKAALVSGDVGWVEAHVGKLTDSQCILLTCMLQREAW